MQVTVFAGSSRRAGAVYLEAARQLGAALARRGHVVIYGGGRTGLMGALADAALAAGGSVRGVILRGFIEQDVHHRGLHELTPVEDMRSRKAGLDACADAFIALPGGFGTLEELTEILSFRKLRLHHRPLILVNTEGFFDPLLAQVERSVEAGFEDPEHRGFLGVAASPEQAVAQVESAVRRRRGSPAPRRRGR